VQDLAARRGGQTGMQNVTETKYRTRDFISLTPPFDSHLLSLLLAGANRPLLVLAGSVQCFTLRLSIRGSADKSLARPGRKQATATKLGIYSTYSPPSSIHFFVRCSNFCKQLKKFRSLSVQLGHRGSNNLRVG
jgi:hypothetical protein